MYDHLDVMGEDLQTVGAVAPQYAAGLARRAAMTPFARAVAAQRPAWLGLSSEQGVSLPKEELDFLPFAASSNLDATHGYVELTTYPQRPFRGERLIISAAYTPDGETTAQDGLSFVIITPAIYVGATQVGATQGSTPASAFGATAFGVRLSLPSAGQGTRILIPVQANIALTGDAKIAVSATLIGRAVR